MMAVTHTEEKPEKVTRKTAATRHVQSRKHAALLSEYEQCVRTLEQNDIPFNLSDAPKPAEQRRFRSQHTRGNTKSQRKHLKRQQAETLQCAIVYMRAILQQHNLTASTAATHSDSDDSDDN